LTAAFITGTTTVLAVYGKERTQRKQKKEREHVNARKERKKERKKESM